jgi:hypothetical protein
MIKILTRYLEITFPKPSCEIVALQENFVDRPESYDSFSAKSLYFLRTVGIYFSIPIHNLPKARYQNIPKTFTYYSRTITYLTKFDFPLPRDKASNLEYGNTTLSTERIVALRSVNKIFPVSYDFAAIQNHNSTWI